MKAAITILSIIVFIGLCVGGWFLYWGVQQANTDQQYKVNRNSQQYQSSLIQQERDRVTGYDNATDEGQKKNIAETFCAAYTDIHYPTQDLVSAQARICN